MLLVLLLLADGPGDNIPTKVRPIPPKGVEIDAKDRTNLRAEVDRGRSRLKGLKPAMKALAPDAEVLLKAVDWALRHDEFFAKDDAQAARRLLQEAHARIDSLEVGKHPWTSATGLVVRGFVSKIDGSVQPYGLVVPKGHEDRVNRLDVWLHGRMENATELRFIDRRMREVGEFAPRGAFVLHPFGRYSNAFKLAGEVDVLEALDHVQKNYRIDEDRVAMRGFSMGGAGCWQMAAHYPGKWCAAAPGAGFSETPLFLRDFQGEKLAPTWYEKKLWQHYDVPGYAINFHGLPVVAYSGEKDKQKQAADVMAEALEKEGIRLVHLVGPGTGHSYHPETKRELAARIDRLAAKGRERVPRRVRFTTPTLRYNEAFWIRLDALEEHWKPAKVDAVLGADRITIKTENVAGLTVRFGPGECPFDGPFPIIHNGKELETRGRQSDWSFRAVLSKKAEGLRKVHGLQGPIDDAFLSRFIIVRPTGKPMHEKTGAWAKAEMERAIREWRRQFRGDAIVKDDRDVTKEDIESSNLVLWGDPPSNSLIGKVLPKLPLKWDAKALSVAGKSHESAGHVVALIYPNPLNERKYVVLNSGVTYREYDYLNNARQHAKLPDWAVIDLSTPPGTQWPGKVADADFFDEGWKVKERK